MRNKKSVECCLVALLTLLAGRSVRAVGCDGFACLLNDGALALGTPENPSSIRVITADFADDVRGGHAHPMFDFVTAAQPNAGFASCYGSRHGLTDRY